jgi:hypothetical protein
MSQNFEINANESTEPVSKYAIAIRYGLMTGFISMFLTTINFLYLLKINYIAFLIGGFLMFVVPIIFYGIVGLKQRKILGGFISIRDAFQAIFIVILISMTINTIYGLIYNHFIDPDFINRMKDSMIDFFGSLKMPEEQLDEIMKKVDEATASVTKPSKIFFSYAQGIIFQSIFGFIVALIIKKERIAAPQ